MLLHAYKHARFMEESESRVEMSAYLHSPVDDVVSRMRERPDAYRRWEIEHDRLMHGVSDQPHFDSQVSALRSTAFTLVHRRALFEYVRHRQVTGAKRHRLLALFYGCRDYTNAVLAEHGNYARCSSSYVCTQYLGEALMHDAAFSEPLQLYEQWYAEYFRVYCDAELAETEVEQREQEAAAALRPLLKHRLSEARAAILALPPLLEEDWREVKIRKPNGDTQRMRALFGSH
jgi:hypothetical protein